MSSLDNFRQRVVELVKPLVAAVDGVPALLDALEHPDAIDDHLLLLENLLTFLSQLNDGKKNEVEQKIAQDLSGVVIDFLYKDLPHPPSGYLALDGNKTLSSVTPSSYSPGVSAKYAYRSADGSNYNPLIPSLGQAGTPYARSVPGTLQTNLKALPNAGLVFDTLLRRPEEGGPSGDGFEPHPAGFSSLFFAFADIIVHSIFNTDHKDPTINNVSSYLDLSIVYGSSDKEVESVRRRDDNGSRDGTGRLYDDVFADARLLLMPPATCALLVLFSRNHNYIAQKIYDINESGTYKDPASLKADIEAGSHSSASDDAKAKAAKATLTLNAQDDEIFHRSRLVNSAFFVQCILGDYVGAILGQVRDGYYWRLNPLMDMRRLNHEVSPRGEGNVISLEFNLLYRWHAALSKQDAQWTGKMLTEALKHEGVTTPVDQLSPEEFYMAAGKTLKRAGDVRTWTFEGLKRDSSGRFADSDIARLLQDSTSYRAGAFRARGIPAVLRVIEVLGIEQARSWGACSLNEFRKFMGLKPYKTFEDWNSDKEVANAARALYKDIDNLELHVGMQAEETKKPGPGAGFCPGYTISRSILGDAVALTRGDRFLTVDFTPFNLTTWGYADCQYPTSPDGSYGGMLTKLLFRHLPEFYPPRSAYAHFPLIEPSYMEDYLTKKGDLLRVQQYTWTRPKPPVGTGVPQVIGNYAGAKEIVDAPKEWKSGYEERLVRIVGGNTNGRIPNSNVETRALLSLKKEWAEYFVKTTRGLLKEKSIAHVGSKPGVKYVDVVDDIINVLPVRWICEKLAGLPPKKDHTAGIDITQLQDICRYVYVNLSSEHDWQLRESSVALFRQFNDIVKHRLDNKSSILPNTASHILSLFQEGPAPSFITTLYDNREGKSNAELAMALFCEVVPTAAHWAQSVAHVINYYLDTKRQTEKAEIVKLVKEGESGGRVMELIKNALVDDPPISAVYRTAQQDAVVQGIHTQVAADERVLVSVIEANKTRPKESTGILGLGEHGLLSTSLFETITPGVIGEILSLPNVQRGPGLSGVFSRFTETPRGAPEQMYIDAHGGLTPFPNSLVISYTA